MINDIDPKDNFVSRIRKNPKKVEMHVLETDKVVLYPSTYKGFCSNAKAALLWHWNKIPE